MTRKLAVIVLTWKDWQNTLKCLESIHQQDYNKFKVFIVDNHSNDETFNKINAWSKNKIKITDKLLKHKNKKLKILDLRKKKLNSNNLNKFKFIFVENKKNLGCGLGHNSGYKIALKHNFEFIARIDNDMVLPKKFFFKI